MLYQHIRDRIEQIAPRLADELDGSRDLLALENLAPEVLASMFRRSGTTGLACQQPEFACQVSPLDVAYVVQWVGSYCPSLAIMMTMHHHTVAGFATLAPYMPTLTPVLRQIARAKLLVASAFAEESTPSESAGSRALAAHPNGKGYTLNGVKQPCTMAGVMDLILVGIKAYEADDSPALATAIVRGRDSGIRREQFWRSPYLAASDSNSLVFDNVNLGAEQVILPEGISSSVPAGLRAPEMLFLTWFQLLVSAAYAGMYARLIEELSAVTKPDDSFFSTFAATSAGAMAAIEKMAAITADGKFGSAETAHCCALRYAVQTSITRAGNRAVEAAGGIAAMQKPEINYLRCCLGYMAFHPPRPDKAMRLMNGS